MGNIKDYIIKKKILIIITLIAVIVGIGITSVSITNAEERKKIVLIEELITEGNYDKAKESIDEFINEYSPNVDESIYEYIEILSLYSEINSSDNNEDTKDKIEKLKNDYSELLSKDIFVNLNESLLQKEKSIEEYLKRVEEISQLKQKIVDSIENDIESAKALIDDFKKNYPEEDISDIENKYNEKVKDIEKSEEEKKAEQIIEENYVDTNNNSASAEKHNLTIADTVAAQNSNQIITVVSNGGSYGELVMWEKDNSGNWSEVDRVAARLGQNGMKYASEVYEMDKCTPTGIYSVTEAFGINGDPGSGVPYRVLDGSEYWVDDVDSQYYNTMQFGEPNGRWSSAEKLIDYPGYYNYSLVIDYNRWPVIAGKSSAIFLHCDMGIYTYGCVAIPQSNMINLLTWLDPSSNPVIILDFTYEDIYNNY